MKLKVGEQKAVGTTGNVRVKEWRFFDPEIAVAYRKSSTNRGYANIPAASDNLIRKNIGTSVISNIPYTTIVDKTISEKDVPPEFVKRANQSNYQHKSGFLGKISNWIHSVFNHL